MHSVCGMKMKMKKMRVKFYDMNKQPIGCMQIAVPKLARDFIQSVRKAGTEFNAGYVKVNGHLWRI